MAAWTRVENERNVSGKIEEHHSFDFNIKSGKEIKKTYGPVSHGNFDTRIVNKALAN